jgi:curli biogenesis system outer membrane secretion channel CsgG
VGAGRVRRRSGRRQSLGVLVGALALVASAPPLRAGQDPPLGPAYHGPKCVVTVGEFRVLLQDAPPEIGGGLRQMLSTALFESNWFLVADRGGPAGIPAAQLLGDTFLDDPEALLREGKTAVAAVLITGALTDFEDGGLGLRLKVPGAPVKVGGALSEARVVIDLQATDTASGRILATQTVTGSAVSGSARVGAVVAAADLPVELQAVRNTPLELAFRDCIYRAVIGMIKALPRERFCTPGP